MSDFGQDDNGIFKTLPDGQVLRVREQIDRFRSEMLLDSLRRAYRSAVNTLIAAGISETDACRAAVFALAELLSEESQHTLKLMGVEPPEEG